MNKGAKGPTGRKLRPAAVLVATQIIHGDAYVLLTKRSSAMRHHPGQIAFPGGKQDDDDHDLTDTALREAQEEIGLPRDCVEILGELPPHETVTGFLVTPVLSFVTKPFYAIPEYGEVDEVFKVPLDHVTNPQHFRVESREWLGQQRFYYTVPFGPYYIWGATARILRSLADSLQS
nr:CoA pyrophosphatase [Pseudaestuariivita rosea]